MKKYILLFVLFISLSSSYALAGDKKAPDPLTVLMGMEDAYTRINDYTAVFIKQERVGDKVLPEERARLKFKKPFKVYMKWVQRHEGREALYVHGENGNKVIGHDTGLKGIVAVNMDPRGSLAMKDNRHPITDVGIGRMIDFIMGDVRLARKNKELNLRLLGEESVHGRPAIHVQGAAPPLRGGGYYGRSTDIWVDRALGIPVKVIVYGWENEFLERYEYKDLKINQGLKDEEFRKDFGGYNF